MPGSPMRLCLAIECTARLTWLWQNLLKGLIEPLLSQSGLEMSLVLFGAHASSLAPVESSLGWLSSVDQFRRLLDGLEFVGGGGGQPVALAEALACAASLFALPSADGTLQPAPPQHCLICLASEPSVRPVPWTCAEDCGMAKLPGLATSVEMCRALRRHGINLGFAGGNLFDSPSLLWHLANLVSDDPLSLQSAVLEQPKRQGQDGVLQQLVQSSVTLPVGAMAVLPFWPQAVEAALRSGGKALPSAAALGAHGKSLAPGSDMTGAKGVDAAGSLEPLLPQSGEAAAKRARLGAASQPSPTVPAPATAGVSARGSAGGPSGAMAALIGGIGTTGTLGTPPLPPGTSPGSFMDVLNAEILMSPDDASPAQDAALAALVMQQQAAVQPPASLQQQTMQQPSVQGLPLPPIRTRMPQTQQQQYGLPATAGAGGDPSASSTHALIHTANVIVDPKATGKGHLMLGVGQILGVPQHAPYLSQMSWPLELHIAKLVSINVYQEVIQTKKYIQTRLDIQFASQEAQAFIERLVDKQAAAILPLHGATVGMFQANRHPQTSQLMLLLLIVPDGGQRS